MAFVDFFKRYLGMENTVVLVEGKKHRVTDSILHPAKVELFCSERAQRSLCASFAKRGIADYVNALPPRSKARHVQLFIMLNGTAEIADSRIVAEVLAEVKG